MEIVRRTRFQEIRKVWPKENQFSDWLISQEGYEFLAEELGIELENLRRESRPGDFPCDIVGNLLGDEHHIVVIENQYGKTNHDHLGKLLTYAAVHKAMTGIWISETISDDHRQVIDWLNENTPDNVNLYLVGLRLYRVGDKQVSPQLDVVCRPNILVKESKRTFSESDLEIQAWCRSMWEKIHESIQKSNPPFRLQRAGSDHWSSITIGRSDFHLNMLLNTREKRIGVDLVINVPWKRSAFETLLLEKNAIESEIGAELDWLPMPDKRRSRILLEAPIDPKNPSNEPEVLSWFTRRSTEFYLTFKERVASLPEPSE
jgi:hypothetical protein